MQNGRKDRQGGFAYLSVLILVAVMSIMAFQVSGTLSARLNRGKEADLLFNGEQIARAIRSYFESGPVRGCYPKNLEVLLEDKRSFKTMRHLRKIYSDPMHVSTRNPVGDPEDSLGMIPITGPVSTEISDGGWIILRDPTNRVIGVQSKSTNTPYQQRNFPKEQKDFEGKSSYADWKFIAKDSKVKPASPAVCNQ